MRLAALSALALALTLALPAHAADQTEAQKSAVALAKLVVTPESYKEMFDKMTEAIAANTPPGQEPKSPAFWKKFRAGVETLLPFQELLDDQAGLLVKYYTADEIKQLAAFYSTPLGQKALKIMPALSADVMNSMQHRMQQRLPGFVQKLEEEESKAAPAPAPAPAPKKK